MYSEHYEMFKERFPDYGRKLWSLAARWYDGIEDDESINAMTQHNFIVDKEPDYRRTVYQKPMLTLEERDRLYRMVGRRI